MPPARHSQKPRKVYAVRNGSNIGVFNDIECAQAATKHFSCARWRRFPDVSQAMAWMHRDPSHPANVTYYAVRDPQKSSPNHHSNYCTYDDMVRIHGPPNGRYTWRTFKSLALANLWVQGEDNPEFGWCPGSVGHGPRTNHIYVDGCCLNNGQPGARGGWGLYWLELVHPFRQGPIHRPSNNRAELTAICRALDLISETDRRDEQHFIYTDSAYAMSCLGIWGDRWEREGWRTRKGKMVHNHGIIQDARNRLKNLRENYGFRIDIVKVDGHSGIEGNEIADSLANEAARRS